MVADPGCIPLGFSWSDGSVRLSAQSLRNHRVQRIHGGHQEQGRWLWQNEQGHGVQCTESFMRENVMDELKQMQPEDESKKKMLDILKRLHLEEEMESDGEDGEEIRLEDLSDSQIKRFRQALASGELSKMIEPWIPWWKKPSARSISLGPDGSQLIKQVNTEDNAISYPDPETDQEASINEIPEGPESPLPSLKQLTRTEPSPMVIGTRILWALPLSPCQCPKSWAGMLNLRLYTCFDRSSNWRPLEA